MRLRAALVVCWCGAAAVVRGAPGSAGAAALLIGKLPVGPRATALAGSAVALDGEPTAMYWNPAGVATVGRPTATAVHVEQGEDVRMESLCFGQPLVQGGALAVGASLISLPPMIATYEDAAGGYAGTGNPINTYEYRIAAAYAQDLGRLAPVEWLGPLWTNGTAGLAVAFLGENIAGTVAQTPTVDAGYRYNDANAGLAVGAAIRSLGAPVHGSPLPVTFETGIAQAVADWTLTGDFLSGTDDAYRVRFGAEWAYVKGAHRIALRGGWQHSFASGLEAPFAAGLGYRLVLPGDLQLTLDYAFQPVHGLDDLHALSLAVGL